MTGYVLFMQKDIILYYVWFPEKCLKTIHLTLHVHVKPNNFDILKCLHEIL